MALSEELVSRFVRATNDKQADTTETTFYGTVVEDGESLYVQIDGSTALTPVTSTVVIEAGDRVMVSLKGHSAVVIGNLTDPSTGVRLYVDIESGLMTKIEESAAGIRKDMADTVNGLNTTIEESATGIRAEMADEVEGLKTTIDTQAGQIETLVDDGEEFTKFKQTVEGFLFEDDKGTVKIDGGSIDLTGAIKWTDLNGGVQGTINLISQNASDANDNADDALGKVSNILKAGTTYLDGEKIYSGSIYGDALHLGGLLKVYQSLNSNTLGGYIGYDSGFNSNTGIGIKHSNGNAQCVCTDQAARLSNGNTTSVVCGSSYLYLDGTAIKFELSGADIFTMANHSTYYALRPSGTGSKATLGNASIPWTTVYASDCTACTSDQNKKNSIEDLPEKYITFFDNLKPRRFKLNNGTSDRYHVGYIAQEVEDAMKIAGIDSLEFAGFIKDTDEDGNDIYMLRYGEFESIYDLKIKQLEARYETKIAALESRLAKLEELLTASNN